MYCDGTTDHNNVDFKRLARIAEVREQELISDDSFKLIQDETQDGERIQKAKEDQAKHQARMDKDQGQLNLEA